MDAKSTGVVPTVAQIARQCGTSVVTVSRALRADTAVAPETRANILAVAEAAGYRPRVRMGRPRRASKIERPFIEVIMGVKFHTTFYSVLLQTVECELAERGYDCVIRSANGAYSGFVRLCEVLRATPEVPTLLVGYLPTPQLRTLLEVRPRTLLVDHTGDPSLSMPYSSVGFDNVEAARMMARHLLAGGRRRILLLKGFAEHYFSREIEQGYREALAQAGVETESPLILATDYTVDDAVAKLDAAMEAGLKFDALFSNDELAAAALCTLRKRGRRVPEDVALGGCDGLPYGAFLTPPLTTVHLDHVRLGRLAVAQILDRETALASPTRTRLVPTLVVRESTPPVNEGKPTCPI